MMPSQQIQPAAAAPPLVPPKGSLGSAGATPSALDTEGQILDRLDMHFDKDQKNINYNLRLVTANALDLDGTGLTAIKTETERGDVLKRGWEEGRYNPITTDTHMQAKSLTINEPDLHWSKCLGKEPEITALIRQAHYIKNYREQFWQEMYLAKILDMLITGEGSVQAGVRDGKVFMEYADSLLVSWDTAFKEPHLKRFVFRDRAMTKAEALRRYPKMAEFTSKLRPDGRGGEASVKITFYFSKTTMAVLFGKNFLIKPQRSPYPCIPLRQKVLFREPSVKHPTGLVDKQIGTAQLMMRLRRSMSQIALRGVPVGVALGQFASGNLDKIESGEEGQVLRSESQGASFEWKEGAKLPAAFLELENMLRQAHTAESGSSDFQRGQTDTKVDFASQLALIAQQSGAIGQFTASQHEQGVADDARLFMEIAAMYEKGPVSLNIKGAQVDFDQMMPIGVQLGADGDLEIRPLIHKAPAQKLQETMIFIEVVNLVAGSPPGLARILIDQACTAFEVDDKDEYLTAYDDALKAQADERQQAMAIQLQSSGGGAQGAGGGAKAAEQIPGAPPKMPQPNPTMNRPAAALQPK